MTQDDRADDQEDEPDPQQVNVDPRPQESLQTRVVRFLVDNSLLVLSALGLALFVYVGLTGKDVPRSAQLIGISMFVWLPAVGRPVGKRVVSMLWDPSVVWVVDVDARYPGQAGIFAIPSDAWTEFETTDGSLDWVSPSLVFARNVDLEAKTVEGTWRGTLSDRELLTALSAVKECRETLEKDAKRGFAVESQAWTIVRSATRSAVREIVATFERGTLPDRGESIDDAIDDALDSWGLDRDLRGESPFDDLPGDGEYQSLDAAAKADAADGDLGDAQEAVADD